MPLGIFGKPNVRGCKTPQFGSQIPVSGDPSFRLELGSSGPVLTGLG